MEAGKEFSFVCLLNKPVRWFFELGPLPTNMRTSDTEDKLIVDPILENDSGDFACVGTLHKKYFIARAQLKVYSELQLDD